jgi:hypothetical protein
VDGQPCGLPSCSFSSSRSLNERTSASFGSSNKATCKDDVTQGYLKYDRPAARAFVCKLQSSFIPLAFQGGSQCSFELAARSRQNLIDFLGCGKSHVTNSVCTCWKFSLDRQQKCCSKAATGVLEALMAGACYRHIALVMLNAIMEPTRVRAVRYSSPGADGQPCVGTYVEGSVFAYQARLCTRVSAGEMGKWAKLALPLVSTWSWIDPWFFLNNDH